MGQNLALMAWPSLIIFSTIASDRTIVNDHVETNLIAELNKAYVKKENNLLSPFELRLTTVPPALS